MDTKRIQELAGVQLNEAPTSGQYKKRLQDIAHQIEALAEIVGKTRQAVEEDLAQFPGE